MDLAFRKTLGMLDEQMGVSRAMMINWDCVILQILNQEIVGAVQACSDVV